MRYDAVLIDVDDTLLDFQEGERRALANTLSHYAMNTPLAESTYRACNEACWRALERGEIDQHTLRYKRFRDFLWRMHRADDPVALGDYYMNALAHESIPLPGAQDALREIAARVPIAAVTNGISFIQHGRMDASPLRPYLSALIISEEIGAAKPNPRIIHEALRALGGIAPCRALMVGDSIQSDIACARNAGTDACWYNPQGKPRPKEPPIRYEIQEIGQLPGLVLGEGPDTDREERED